MATLPAPTYNAKDYSSGRPNYPRELFQFIASNTPCHDLAWDVGTGTGQAIPFRVGNCVAHLAARLSPTIGLASHKLAETYKNVIGTDISPTQLEYAPKLPNVKYQATPPVMSMVELKQMVTSQSTLDLITIAQAMHWFELPRFYELVRWALKKPNGVIAAWCYTTPEVNEEVDKVFWPFYKGFSRPGWKETTAAVDDKYRSIWFPFEPVQGLDNNGPFEFKAEKVMRLEDYLAYIRSWSAYNAAKAKGVEMLSDEILEKFEKAWNCDGKNEKIVNFPVYLRLGRVGDS